MQGETRALTWVLWALILSAFVVPFTLLRHVSAWYGSFLYWSAFALAVIAIIVRLTRNWVD